MLEEIDMVDLGEVDARRSVPSSEEECKRVFDESRERVRQLTSEQFESIIHILNNKELT
jgi:hypothetical protein